MPLGNRLTTPQTDWQQAQKQQVKADRKDARKQMKQFERESMAQGLEEDPTASGYSEAYHNMEKYGFDPPPDVPTFGGSPGRNIPGLPLGIPPLQPGAVDPATGGRNFPLNPSPLFPTAPLWDAPVQPDWEAYLRDQAMRGMYRSPQRQGGNIGGFQMPKEPLPATKVFSAPIGAMTLPPPLPPPG